MNHTPTSEQIRYSKLPTGGVKSPIVAIPDNFYFSMSKTELTYTVVTQGACGTVCTTQ